MEVSASNIRRYSDEEALRSLLEAFGSLFSVEEISSAYRKAGQDADVAGQILYGIQEKTYVSSSLATNGKLKHKESSELSYNKVSYNPYPDGKSKAPKQKWRAVSAGTVSSVLGKDYVKSMPVDNGSCLASKPLKLDEEFPASEIWGEGNKQDTVKNDYMHKDMGDFLFKLLGNGFKLERDAIQQVLDKCGYDMQKSMEELLDLSANTLEKGKKGVGNHTEKLPVASSNSGEPSHLKDLEPANCSEGGTGKQLAKHGKEKTDLEKEVLVALFNGTKKPELSRRAAKVNRRSIALGEPVVEHSRDFALEIMSDPVDAQQENLNDEDDGGEDNYQLLRKAVKEYRTTMKEYYKAAVAAFAKEDHDRANKLMHQGHFFCEKAREADEESSKEIFKIRNTERQEDLVVDLHAHGPKEAIRLLKCHLSSFAGTPSFMYLKVILEKNDEDIAKGTCRRVVMKLLEKESIKWTEGEELGTILIHLDGIKRNQLSFTKS